MTEEASLLIRLKMIDETRNYLLEEIRSCYLRRNWNWGILISKNHKKTCRVLNHVEHWLILASAVTGCVFISEFASLVRFPIVITTSALGLKFCEK